jgi:WD40 repeat protein/predicted Ser/Thr protein kinase
MEGEVEERCPRCKAVARRLVAGLCARCLIAGAMKSPAAPVPGGSGRAGLLSIPGYTVTAEIARGGMGVVYRASQADPARDVALKMLRPQSLESPEMLERFRQEAQTLAALDHPAILPVYDTGEEEGLPWFTMKLATGGTLATRKTEFSGRWREIAELVVRLAEAVQFAHERGVLHRDIKPGNVLFDDANRAFVADFGLARVVEKESDLTRSLTMLGTPHYIAPEIAMADARAATTSSDIYGLGAVLYELLTGRPPFEADSVPALLRRIADTEPPQPSRIWSGMPRPMPRDLEVICLKCLSKSPDRRYGSARELAADLRRWLDGHPIQARAAGAGERLLAWSRRNPALAVASAAAISLLVAMVAVVLGTNRSLRRADQTLRANLYAADMALAATAIDRDDFDAARRLLEAQRPSGAVSDLRGIEWRILSEMATGDSPRAFTNHFENCIGILPSSDGRTVVSASWDGTVREWEFSSARELRKWNLGGSNQWFAIARQPGGPLVAAVDAGRPGAILIDLKSGEEKRFPDVRSQFIAFTPDRTNIVIQSKPAFWSVDGDLELLDLGFRRLRTLKDTGLHAAFSPDGTKVATGSWGEMIRLWSWPSMNLIAEMGPVSPLIALDFSPDGRRLVSAGFNGDLKLWDVARGTLISAKVAHKSTTLGSARFSPDGRRIATAGGNHVLEIWSGETLAHEQTLHGHADQVWALAWHPDGRSLLSTTRSHGVRVWPLDEERRVRGNRKFRDCTVLFTPDGKQVLTEDLEGLGAVLIDTDTLHETARNPDAQHVVGLLPGQNAALAVDETGWRLRRFSLSDLKEVREAAVSLETNGAPPGKPGMFRMYPGGGVLGARFPDGSIRTWDVATGAALPAPDSVRRCDCEFWALPNGRLVMADNGFELMVVDARSGKTTARLAGHRAPPGAVEMSPDGSLLATADNAGEVILWDAATFEIRKRFHEFDNVTRVRFSADGKTLVVADYQRLQFLHLQTGRVAGGVPVEALSNETLAIAPDDSAIALIGRDERLHFWRASPKR